MSGPSYEAWVTAQAAAAAWSLWLGPDDAGAEPGVYFTSGRFVLRIGDHLTLEEAPARMTNVCATLS